MTVDQARTLCGRTLDLDAAYKQILTSKSSLWCSVLAVESDLGEKKLFVSNVLPFGASAAVYAFNRIARAIHTIGERLFGLVWSNYYDDYPQLDLSLCGTDSQVTAERLLDLIGWRFSRKESKRKPMDFSFDVLGVTFDLSQSWKGLVIVRNKSSRVLQITSEVEQILSSGSFSGPRASSLRGKLQFAESHCYGRALAANLRFLQQRACGKLPGSYVDKQLTVELNWAKWFINQDQPRILHSGMSLRRAVIFTDASLEDDGSNAGIGMVAFVHDGKGSLLRFFFSEKVPANILASWQSRTKKIIATLELFAAVVACEVLADFVQDKRVFLFIDNEAARASLIAMYSSVLLHNVFLKKLSMVSQKRNLFMWIARVPSASNCSFKLRSEVSFCCSGSPISAMAVAERMNMSIFNQVPVGSAARLAGRCEFQAESQQWILQTFEGAKLVVNSNGMSIQPNQLVEIIGTKGPQGELCVTGVCKLPEGEIDGNLWNEAVQMAHHEKLRHLFQPMAA
eukprot:Skav215748  [mRNA]  locus=scaffold106:161897:165124:+ [translate_table: standard]